MTTPATYRKRPVVVEAMNWDGTPESATPIINWMLANDTTATWSEPYEALDRDGIVHPAFGGGIKIQTLEGTMVASVGDWIIKGTRGEFYPCKPGPFADTFEPVVASQPVPSYRAFLGETPCQDPSCECHPKAATDPEAMREAASRLLTAANEAEADELPAELQAAEHDAAAINELEADEAEADR